MTESERDAVHFLINSAEESVAGIMISLRLMQRSKEIAEHRNATTLHSYVASIDSENAMSSAIAFTQRSEQLFAKLREVLPAIENESWGGNS